MRNAGGVTWGALGGLLGMASVAWPADLFLRYGQPVWWLQLLSLCLYALALQRSGGGRNAVWGGFSYHWILLLGSISWLHTAMDTYGGLPVPLAWMAVGLLCFALSVYGAAMAWVYARVAHSHPRALPFLFAACWLLAELARGQWLTGFGWSASAYSHVDGPLAALAPWIGGYGVGAVAAFLAASLVHAWAKKHRRVWIPIAVLVTLVGFANNAPDFTVSTGTLDVSLLQGNIAQDEKFDSTKGLVDSLAWYGRALEGDAAALVLAPETAIPVLPQQLPASYLESLAAAAATQKSVKLLGIPLGNHEAGYTNSVIAIGSPNPTSDYRYDKHHLVPFGEFIPPFFKWFVRMMHIPLGDFNRGDRQQASLVLGQQKIAPSICYEDLFSEELAVRFQDAGSSPTIFANFSNLAWFGNSTAMYQHLQISRLRSLEFERPFLRVSNNGITSVVDHRGGVTAQIAPFTRGVLKAKVEGRSGLTPYAWWSARFGMWPLWGLAVAVLLWAGRKRSLAAP